MKKVTHALGLTFFAIITGCASVSIPNMEGAYLVGTTRIDFTDASRSEQYLDQGSANRRVSAQIWFPVDAVEAQLRDFYFDADLSSAMVKYMGIPAFILGSPKRSQSFIDAPISERQRAFPVVIFNHGYGSFAKQNYSQMEALASRGFIVFSISHPYTSILTQFADGSIVERAENPYWLNIKELEEDINQVSSTYNAYVEKIREAALANEKQAILFEISGGPMYALLEQDFNTWVEDTIFIIRSLPSLNKAPGILLGKIDYERLGIYGHSFGGAVSAEVALRMPTEIQAGINLDGPCLSYEPNKAIELRMPFMFVYSTDLKLGSVVCDHSGLNDAYFLDSKADSYSVVLKGSAHHNFSDMTYVKILKRTSMLGPIDNIKAGDITSDLVVAFFDSYLRDKQAALLSLEAYPELLVKSKSLPED